MTRTSPHVIETKSRQILESALANFSNDTICEGDLLFRVTTERDYGIDGMVELFSSGEPTGRMAHVG